MYSYFNHFSSIHIEILQCIHAIYSTEEHHKTLKRIVTQDIKMDFYPIFCPQKLKIVLCVHVKVESDLDTNDNNPKTHKIHSHLSSLTAQERPRRRWIHSKHKILMKSRGWCAQSLCSRPVIMSSRAMWPLDCCTGAHATPIQFSNFDIKLMYIYNKNQLEKHEAVKADAWFI